MVGASTGTDGLRAFAWRGVVLPGRLRHRAPAERCGQLDECTHRQVGFAGNLTLRGRCFHDAARAFSIDREEYQNEQARE